MKILIYLKTKELFRRQFNETTFYNLRISQRKRYMCCNSLTKGTS